MQKSQNESSEPYNESLFPEYFLNVHFRGKAEVSFFYSTSSQDRALQCCTSPVQKWQVLTRSALG